MKRIFLSIGLIALGFTTALIAHGSGGGFQSGGQGPILTIPATTSGKGSISLDVEAEYVKFESFRNQELVRAAEQGLFLESTQDIVVYTYSLLYGVTDDFDMSLILPWIRQSKIKEGEVEDDGAGETDFEGHSSGLGDLTLFTRYRLLNGDLQVALLAGIKAPTGENDQKTRKNRRHALDHQPGTGSWDPIWGFAVSKQIDDISLDGNFLHTITNEGSQKSELGDVYQLNFAVSKLLTKKLSGSLELNGEKRNRDNIRGAIDPNTGGESLVLTPGARFSFTDNFSISLATSLPLWEHQRGEQTDASWQVIAGASYSF